MRNTRDARKITHRLLIDWERTRPHADEILHKALEKSELDSRDSAFVTELFYGVIRNLSALDFRISRLRDGELDDETRAALRLGLYQLFYTRVPPWAAINESVGLSRRAGGLINAILRRADRERGVLDAALVSAADEVRANHPGFLLDKWKRNFGEAATHGLVDWNNTPARITVRVNTLKILPDELHQRLEGANPHPFHRLAFTIAQLHTDLLSEGLFYVQDPSTLAACDLLAPREGDAVLDACAAPGGKTTYLAALMKNRGTIVACDLWQSRVDRLRENLKRLGVTNTRTLTLDTMKDSSELSPRSFDRILIDAPCSNTGVMRRKADVRWRLSDEDAIRMPPQQLALIRRCAGLLKSGGTLVYSTCSLEPEENEQVADEASRTIPGLRLHTTRHVRPWSDGVDGAFAAQFVAA